MRHYADFELKLAYETAADLIEQAPQLARGTFAETLLTSKGVVYCYCAAGAISQALHGHPNAVLSK